MQICAMKKACKEFKFASLMVVTASVLRIECYLIVSSGLLLTIGKKHFFLYKQSSAGYYETGI